MVGWMPHWWTWNSTHFHLHRSLYLFLFSLLVVGLEACFGDEDWHISPASSKVICFPFWSGSSTNFFKIFLLEDTTRVSIALSRSLNASSMKVSRSQESFRLDLKVAHPLGQLGHQQGWAFHMQLCQARLWQEFKKCSLVAKRKHGLFRYSGRTRRLAYELFGSWILD